MILQKPIITEKSMKLAGNGLYTFLVSKTSNKLSITKAVKEAFKVDVINVQTVNVKGEVKMQRKVRRTYKTKGYKKALVQVKKGQIIPIFESPKDTSTGSAQGVTVTTAESEPQVLKEKKDILRRTKVKVEKTAVGAAPSTQRKVIPT